MKHSITLVLVVLTVVLAVGCSVKIPEVFNMDKPGLIEYHKTDAGSYEVYDFDLIRYPELKGQIVGIIKNNQTGWRYYYEGLLGESSPYILVNVYDGSKEIAGMSIKKNGLLIVRDYEKNFLARYKKVEMGTKQLAKLIEEIIEREDISPSR